MTFIRKRNYAMMVPVSLTSVNPIAIGCRDRSVNSNHISPCIRNSDRQDRKDPPELSTHLM